MTRAKYKRRPWTEEERATVKELYPHRPTKEIAAKLGRTITTVYQQAFKLGLEKTQEYLDSPEACRLRRGDNVGAAFRFKPGQEPANKGLRRPGWSPGRMKETQFKKGQRTGKAAENWKPVGTILADSEGYLRIKVREHVHGKEPSGFGNTKVWPLLARHVYEKHFGPIPPQHLVTYKDGDRSNCAPENLVLKSMADNCRDNCMWKRLPRELAEVMQLNGALKRQLRRKMNGKE